MPITMTHPDIDLYDDTPWTQECPVHHTEMFYNHERKPICSQCYHEGKARLSELLEARNLVWAHYSTLKRTYPERASELSSSEARLLEPILTERDALEHKLYGS